ncbi:hypothetical protein AGMMS49556_09690 [Endomicrobiia bacterium]|nr:hypothetical protein AGMMS49556_09690 [Endomicrobiia bacterium]
MYKSTNIEKTLLVLVYFCKLFDADGTPKNDNGLVLSGGSGGMGLVLMGVKKAFDKTKDSRE